MRILDYLELFFDMVNVILYSPHIALNGVLMWGDGRVDYFEPVFNLNFELVLIIYIYKLPWLHGLHSLIQLFYSLLKLHLGFMQFFSLLIYFILGGAFLLPWLLIQPLPHRYYIALQLGMAVG